MERPESRVRDELQYSPTHHKVLMNFFVINQYGLQTKNHQENSKEHHHVVRSTQVKHMTAGTYSVIRTSIHVQINRQPRIGNLPHHPPMKIRPHQKRRRSSWEGGAPLASASIGAYFHTGTHHAASCLSSFYVLLSTLNISLLPPNSSTNTCILLLFLQPPCNIYIDFFLALHRTKPTSWIASRR